MASSSLCCCAWLRCAALCSLSLLYPFQCMALIDGRLYVLAAPRRQVVDFSSSSGTFPLTFEANVTDLDRISGEAEL